MFVPSNSGVAAGTATAGGKNNSLPAAAAAVYSYNCGPPPPPPTAAADAFQPMAMPVNGQYPLASEFLRLCSHTGVCSHDFPPGIF